MNGAKIQLSSFERELVQNGDWILTKRSIIDKVYVMFGNLSECYTSIIEQAQLPVEIKSVSPKISRGENYHGLPYVILDYPRIFDKENIFAVRTLFWWGNYFSSTFQLKGKYKEQFQNFIQSNFQQLVKAGYSISTGEDEWDFRFTENNFKPANEITADEWGHLLLTQSFIKLSIKIPLTNWDNAAQELISYFKINLQSAGINFPGDEINL
jgi:hypothetical protein